MPTMTTKILGHTASGKPVPLPTRGSPDTNDVMKFRKTKAKFPGWSKADHMDASRLLYLAAENAARAVGGDAIARRYQGWSAVHWDIGGRWASPEFEARFSAGPMAKTDNRELDAEIKQIVEHGQGGGGGPLLKTRAAFVYPGNPNWKTRAAFVYPGNPNWRWVTWTHHHGNRHAAIIEKAREIGATSWDFGQADHGLVGDVNF
jgi:hypothetical protein